MKRKNQTNQVFNTFILSLFVIVFFCSCSQLEHQNKKNEKPNVLLFLTDDQGYGDLSITGNPYLKTPHIDNIAREGIMLDRFYVSPVCAPTRASLLTGKYHLRTGVSWVAQGYEILRGEETTVAEIFKDNGYSTACFGKWHNGKHHPNHPNQQGFDHFFGFIGGNCHSYFNAQMNLNSDSVSTTGYMTDVLTDSVISFLEENKSKPFFCYVPYNAPHSPFEVDDNYFDYFKEQGLNDKDACVYGMCKNLDDNIGRVMDVLKKLNLEENTIVMFMTDNGPNGHRYNGGMKGKKATVEEGGVRVPCFIQWKNHLKKGFKVEQLTAHIDILPTLTELCKLNAPTNLSLDGRSLVSLLHQEDVNWEERNIFSTFYTKIYSVRSNRYRYVKGWKDESLFDMINDFGQKIDLSDSLPDVLNKCRKDYDAWFNSIPKENYKKRPVPVIEGAKQIFLPANEAYFTENIRFTGKGYNGDWLINWTSPNDSVWWEISPGAQKQYKLSLLYTCLPGNIGSEICVSINNKTYTKKLTQAFKPETYPYFDRVKRGGILEQTWGKFEIANVTITPEDKLITVSAKNVAKSEVMDLGGIILE